MYPQPQVTWIGSPNYGMPQGTSGRAGYQVIAIVNHIMSGTLVGTDSWFQNAQAQASAHFGVGKNGEIHQYVDINNVAWANGGVANPSWPLLIAGVNPNYYTVSIEHEGESGDQLTEAQYQATLALHRWLCDLYKITPGSDTIIGHFRIDSVNRANDPGSGFPWERLLTDLKEEALVEKAILVFGQDDVIIAKRLMGTIGNCPIMFRDDSGRPPAEIAQVKQLFVVGGQPGGSDVSHPNKVTLAGVNWFGTAVAVGKYTEQLN